MKIKINEPDANIFSLMAYAKRFITEQQTKEMIDRVTKSSSYESAVEIINEYLNDKIIIVK